MNVWDELAGGLIAILCLAVALGSSSPRSVGAAICFATFVWVRNLR